MRFSINKPKHTDKHPCSSSKISFSCPASYRQARINSWQPGLFQALPLFSSVFWEAPSHPWHLAGACGVAGSFQPLPAPWGQWSCFPRSCRSESGAHLIAGWALLGFSDPSLGRSPWLCSSMGAPQLWGLHCLHYPCRGWRRWVHTEVWGCPVQENWEGLGKLPALIPGVHGTIALGQL